jgi:hypothetical protein
MRTLPIQRFSDEEELQLFVDWVLADVAKRQSRGKNPTCLIDGIWVAYGPDHNPGGRGKAGLRKGRGQQRGSDIVARRYVTILALQRSGRSLKDAFFIVAQRLNGGSILQQQSVESIKTGFLKCRSPFRHGWLDTWATLFNDWLNWEIKENLFDHGVPLHILLKVMVFHLERAWGDRRRAVLFMWPYKELVLRAVVLLGRRIEKEQCNEQTRQQ